MSDPKTTLGDLQLAIMRVLWQHREASAAEAHRLLPDERGLALTTIATMLRKMDDRGLVRHRRDGRTFVYRPAVARDEETSTVLAGSTTALADDYILV